MASSRVKRATLMIMPLEENDLEYFRKVLDPARSIFDASSPDFVSHTTPWSLAYDKSPTLALVPETLQELQAIVKYLCDSDIEFAVRGRGVGSSSASDVVLSLKAFRDVSFNAALSTVDIGAGLDWGQVDQQLAIIAPGHVVVGARCPYVGVIGSTLTGGLSWLSHELGLGSDPANLIDAQIVLADGRLVWASQEPDLMWALRGGGGNFGVVANLRLRAHAYTSTIFSGMVHFPPEALHDVSKGVAEWVRRCSDPKMAMHLFVFDFSLRTLHGEAAKPELVALLFDSHGEVHARSESGFKWLLDIPGAKPELREMALPEVHELQRSTEKSHGSAETFLQAALIDEIDDETLVRTCQWYESIANEEPELALGTFALLEIMQKPAFCSTPGPFSTAWPHGLKGRQHVLQLSTGGHIKSRDQSVALKERALKVLREAPERITGRPHPPEDYLPNFLLENHDVAHIFGSNYDKLRQVKRRYDPKGRFNRPGFYIPPA